MASLSEIITFEYESEYVFEYDLSSKPNFSVPKIFSANDDLTKRWYVYFSFRDPSTGKLKRMPPIYGVANRYKTKSERMYFLGRYAKRLTSLLKQGYNPFEDNQALLDSAGNAGNNKPTADQQDKAEAPILVPTPIPTDAPTASPASPASTTVEMKGEAGKTLDNAIEFSLQLKSREVNKLTLRGYENKSKNFVKWIKENLPEIKYIRQLESIHIKQFLNSVLNKSSARNRNNFRTDLSALFQVLEDNEEIPTNLFKKTKPLRTKPTMHKKYSDKQFNDIFSHLKKEDKVLLLFVKFVGYNFLRPIEICRLKIGNIDFDEKTLFVGTKTNPLKTKIIPEILFKEISDLRNLPKEYSLFTPDGIGAVWDVSDDSKRDYFTKRFSKIVKKPLNLEENFTMYGFRHTIATRLYKQLEKQYTPDDAKSKLMHITGHKTRAALEKYLRDIDAALPADYSNMLTSY